MSEQKTNIYHYNGSVVRPFKRRFEDKREMARRYFSMLSAFNGIEITKGELNLLAHIAIRKGIASENSKKEYLDMYKTTMATVDNTVSRLRKKKMLVKIDNKTRINPVIDIDFNTHNQYMFMFKCISDGTK